jgi:hypothetical protein
MHLTKDMEHVNLCGILWYIYLYKCNSYFSINILNDIKLIESIF